ncbi:MAG: iron chelate uptake ABC transporter family permease subunit [Candidatus Entotheonellia bacterium]
MGIFIGGWSIGAVSIEPRQVLHILIDRVWALTPLEQIIILLVRTPNILLAACVGSALAIAGTTFQALLRNPSAIRQPDRVQCRMENPLKLPVLLLLACGSWAVCRYDFTGWYVRILLLTSHP